MAGKLDLAVAIPARNEAELLPRCIQAIERQSGLDGVRAALLVLCNNCTDGTEAIAREMALTSPATIYVRSVRLAEGMAHAGWARRLAMEQAAQLVDDDGTLVCTDADAVADGDWLAQHLRALHVGADAVAGRVSGDWTDIRQLPEAALAVGALEWRYQTAAAELEALLDPVAHDPWPRHRQQSGANIAVRRSAWLAAGGVPSIPCGEDRAFLAAIARAGGRVRHAPDPHVTVSGRLDGRAVGGMSSALAARAAGIVAVDTGLEPADAFVRRLRARARLRRTFQAQSTSSVATSREASSRSQFEAAWAGAEAADPTLRPQLLVADRLTAEVERLEQLLAKVRAAATPVYSDA